MLLQFYEYPVHFKIPGGTRRNEWRRETSEEAVLIVQGEEGWL